MAMKEKKATSQGRKAILKAQKYRNPEKVTGMKNYPRLQKQLSTQLKTAQAQAEKGDKMAVKRVAKLKGELSGLSIMRKDAAMGRRGSVPVATGTVKPYVGPTDGNLVKKSKYEKEYKKMTGKSVKKAQKWYGTSVPTTSVGIGRVNAPKKKDADVALAMASFIVPAGGIVKAGQVVKGAVQAARFVNAGKKAGAAGKFFFGKGSKVILNNTTKAQQKAVMNAVLKEQKAIMARAAAGELSKSKARIMAAQVYKNKVGALWTQAAKKSGRVMASGPGAKAAKRGYDIADKAVKGLK